MIGGLHLIVGIHYHYIIDNFDIDFLVNNDYRGHYNHSYLTTLKNENSDKINTSVIFNFEVEDLISEYERIKN